MSCNICVPINLEKYQQPVALVTGCSGFIGSVLTLELLNRGYKVIGLDNLYRGSSHCLINACDNHPNFRFILGSITNEDLIKSIFEMNDIYVCFNMAGLVGEPICKKEPELASIVNIKGAEVIAKYKSPSTVSFYPSTGSCYGDIGNYCSEEIEPKPISHYAITKLEGEKITLSTVNSYSYRFSTLYGNSGNPRVNLLINNMVFDAVHYRVLNVFQADFKRSFIHLIDAVDAIIYGYEHFHRLEHNLMNVGDPDGNLTKRDVAELIKEQTNCQVFYVEDVYKDTDARNYFVNVDKILQLGWRPRVKITDGINQLIKSSQLINLRNIFS